ncbi:hypothetical protein SAMN05216296_0063 [Pseudomonas pohangensis]|uniref:Uncharacterized protein n=1 Tax=Pseudomonas pohangensis TaxID=364197 RepID=A0A1H2DVN6_9PSED|nr:hypothetical protein [Pseudomonas pohangensis]SDT86902.1 hypothetical protein SAMN05216296_0063 [Pseudomonas pohangensis]
MTRSEEALTSLGFRFGINGPHAARTMMIDDLKQLLEHVPIEAEQGAYAQAVIEENMLGKPTKKARELSYRHLTALYGLNQSNPLFRALRRLWRQDTAAQPLLALAVAMARDPLLRATQKFVLDQSLGMHQPREAVEELLAGQNPDRFSPASLKSFAQNIAGTWTSAGYFSGRNRKTRIAPDVRPENVAMCLFLGYLEGRSGQALFHSSWMQLLALPLEELERLANAAAHRGEIVFMNAGGVKEVRFPDYLTPDEEQTRQELGHDL